MSGRKVFLEKDENSTGFCVSISFANNKISISIKIRPNPGETLQEVSIDDASEEQLTMVCNVLDDI